jgi:hypothetical protein
LGGRQKRNEPRSDGGITAFNVGRRNPLKGLPVWLQVILQSGDRQLGPSSISKLEGLLDSQAFDSIVITAAMGDGEAHRFATQIKNYLNSKDYEAEGINLAVWSQPFQGVQIGKPNDKGELPVNFGHK